MNNLNAKSANTLNKSTVTRTSVVFICVCVALFICLMSLIMASLDGNSGAGNIISSIDDPIRFWFYGLRTPWLTALILPFTHSCDWYWITGACIVLLIIPKTRIKFGIPVSMVALISTIVNNPIKHLVERPRPDDVVHLVIEHSASFPSGHSFTSICFYGMLIILIRRHIKNTAVKNILTVLFAIPMICIGLSRIYCGVHFPTDVFGGWLLGIALMLGVNLFTLSKIYSRLLSRA